MKSKLLIGIKFLSQLGLRPLVLYALYKFGLLTGHYKRLTPKTPNSINSQFLFPYFLSPPANNSTKLSAKKVRQCFSKKRMKLSKETFVSLEN